MQISGNLEEEKRRFAAIFDPEQNFDLQERNLVIGERDAALYFVTGLTKDSVLERVLETLLLARPKEMKDAQSFLECCVPHCAATLEQEEKAIVTAVLSGLTIILVEGFDAAVVMDLREYPQRTTSEPARDKVLRGSRDGFTETMVLNCALIRRRIRDPRLHVEYLTAGVSSKTDVAICWMEGRADPKLLEDVRSRIKSSNMDSLTMNQESMASLLTGKTRWNPFPKYKFTERPDTTAAQILEGDLAILVDNSPSAIILPATLFAISEDANDYYFPPLTGAYLRLTRLIVMLLTLVMTPLWLLALRYPEYVPQTFHFILLDETPYLHPAIQLLLLEFIIDGLKLSSLSTPETLTTSFSIIGAIVFGNYAVESGWFCSDTLLYMSFVAMANYSQPGYELGYAIKYMRILAVSLTALFGVWGFAVAMAVTLMLILATKSPGTKGYFWPVIPFSAKGIAKLLFRL
ncbi:MAG TPA: spore germination protein [Oscillospiraceae bacterium]|nr:spore germination protein [Oscillospiraceae bacterium]HRW56587.1 spore germination protein [Oscillospiraceae bacterium]